MVVMTLKRRVYIPGKTPEVVDVVDVSIVSACWAGGLALCRRR